MFTAQINAQNRRTHRTDRLVVKSLGSAAETSPHAHRTDGRTCMHTCMRASSIVPGEHRAADSRHRPANHKSSIPPGPVTRSTCMHAQPPNPEDSTADSTHRLANYYLTLPPRPVTRCTCACMHACIRDQSRSTAPPRPVTRRTGMHAYAINRPQPRRAVCSALNASPCESLLASALAVACTCCWSSQLEKGGVDAGRSVSDDEPHPWLDEDE